jgi:hypothetical protein
VLHGVFLLGWKSELKIKGNVRLHPGIYRSASHGVGEVVVHSWAMVDTVSATSGGSTLKP